MKKQSHRLQSRAFAALIAAVLAMASGCAKTATVKGTVTFGGKPVTHGSVILLSPDNTAQSGPIDQNGSYIIEGVHPGEVKIGVISRAPSKEHSKAADRGKKNAAAKHEKDKDWFPLPRKYEDPATSGLTCNVGAGIVEHDIALR